MTGNFPDSRLMILPDAARSQWESLLQFIPENQIESLAVALNLAARVQADQWRKSTGETQPVPYIVHPLRVARILAEEWNLHASHTIAAALLHDVLEDCPEGEQQDIDAEIERLAGHEVCVAVRILTKPRLPKPIDADARSKREVDYFRTLCSAPDWVRLIKCADRLDNLRDAIRWGDKPFWDRYYAETLKWHIPMARETAHFAFTALQKAVEDGESKIHGRKSMNNKEIENE